LLVGIDSEDAVPHGWNMTRFRAVLGQPTHLALMRDVFDHMVQRLGVAVPDLGRHTAGDSTGLRGRRDPNATRRAAEVADGLPQASGGRKEYQDDDGKVTKVVEWFGYKLHLLVDVKHEVVLAFDITDTKAGDNERIEALVEQATENVPADRVETLADDKAADDGKVHEMRRFCAHVSAVLVIHLACATLLAKAQRKEGSFGTLRLSPIAKKLEELTAAEKTAALA
jgi:hypothetical protein